MPNIGETKKASDIGYRGHALYRYSACVSCNSERWVRLQDFEQGKGFVCRSCGYPSTNTYQAKQEAIKATGAKRASELGKSKPKGRDPWYYPHLCVGCGKQLWHKKDDMYRVCKECGYTIRKVVAGAEHHNWKGGRYNHGDGYIVVQILPDNPYYAMAHETKYVLEHRLIIAQHLGRCLLDSEVVHHINGNRRDNRIDNLELLPNGASHLPYIFLQQQVKKLEQQVSEQLTRIKILEHRVCELEHDNPVPMRGSNIPQKCVETVQEALSFTDIGETVHSSGKPEGYSA